MEIRKPVRPRPQRGFFGGIFDGLEPNEFTNVAANQRMGHGARDRYEFDQHGVGNTGSRGVSAGSGQHMKAGLQGFQHALDLGNQVAGMWQDAQSRNFNKMLGNMGNLQNQQAQFAGQGLDMQDNFRRMAGLFTPPGGLFSALFNRGGGGGRRPRMLTGPGSLVWDIKNRGAENAFRLG